MDMRRPRRLPVIQNRYSENMKNELVAEILALPLDERVQLVEAIWDSISAFPEALTLTGWQKEELDRRIAEYESDPDAGSSLEEVLAASSGGLS